MTTLRIHPIDASRRMLPERFVAILERDGRTWRQPCEPPTRTVEFKEPAVLLHRIHAVKIVDAPRFRPSASLYDVVGDRAEPMLCMLEQGQVTPRFPDYVNLPKPLQDVLAASVKLDQASHADDRQLPMRALEDRPLAEQHASAERRLPGRDAEHFAAGSRRFEALRPEQRAGLLNLFSKLNAVPLPDGSRPWSHVRELDKVERDRLHARVSPELHIQAVRAAASVAAGGGTPCFTPADGSLHKPPDGYAFRHSFKTRERYGNLQLTFFAPEGNPLADFVDADVDDAAGIEHAEQVIRNEGRKIARALFGWFARNLPEGTTHPYDIHQILRYHQGYPANQTGSACDGRIGLHQPLYALEYRTGDGATHAV